ncbi:hypothetical protein FNF29_03594 [Cafeteria roenbergensis]|uniref:Uncharacterized protein n=1 Tax=Cafeteria roenbergensis TaxID=33653 RepID=A0A5A8CI33_CAFRO|nr:hypothetical protein FNF29_03594 [Cafeteria roenbergensis]|eukprot:KAA0152705.1 hypothetical protein FNF29_03594 [Cafeteria roenbergensis]
MKSWRTLVAGSRRDTAMAAARRPREEAGDGPTDPASKRARPASGLDAALAHVFNPVEHGLRANFRLTDFSKLKG